MLQVNYSGSTGFGRAYRDRLLGHWGLLDIDDCVSGALSVADQAGRSRRLAVRGGSAGGYAVLRAMTTSPVFAAGTSLFGVADLAGLPAHPQVRVAVPRPAVAPWPERRGRLPRAVPAQRRRPAAWGAAYAPGQGGRRRPARAGRGDGGGDAAAGRDVELQVYEGEGHGFRRRDTLVDALEREIAFYGRVLRLGA